MDTVSAVVKDQDVIIEADGGRQGFTNAGWQANDAAGGGFARNQSFHLTLPSEA